MNKILVMVNSKKDLELLKNKPINGIILSIEDLSVNSSFFITIEELKEIIKDYQNKEIFISLNKIMHNSDLDRLTEVLVYLAKIPNIKVLFYDLAVLNIVQENNLNLELVIYQDHLNASTYSNNFYYSKKVKYSFITSDITKEEILEIKNNTKMQLLKLVYGYVPMFYSRRYLISNYMDYIGKEKEDDLYYIKERDIEYPITEEKYGTTIYSKEKIDLIKDLDNFEIDYLVINSYLEDNLNDVIDKFITNKKDTDNHYQGFFKTKTIFKVKE